MTWYIETLLSDIQSYNKQDETGQAKTKTHAGFRSMKKTLTNTHYQSNQTHQGAGRGGFPFKPRPISIPTEQMCYVKGGT